MSRFDLYGGVNCGGCRYYRKSTKCPVYRCDYADNIKRHNWMGPVYTQRPDDINWNKKCQWFKANKNLKENK